jgi:hypothetical protein
MLVLDTVKFSHLGGHYKVEILEDNGKLHAQNYALMHDKTTRLKSWEKTSVKQLRSTDVCRAVIEAERLARANFGN